MNAKIKIRKADERGVADFGWLNSRHSFSFGEYHDPNHMGFGSLRVINDDRVAAGKGFGTHPHRDMEIISYVVSGELAHKDSMGNGSTIAPGDVQRMSAGSGVTHSEFNPSPTNPAHFLQIWIQPEARGMAPSYEQKHFSAADKQGKLKLIGSRDGRDGSVTIHQDVDLYAGMLDQGESDKVIHTEYRKAWIQVVRGSVNVEGNRLKAGDGLSIEHPVEVRVTGIEPAEVLYFDLV